MAEVVLKVEDRQFAVEAAVSDTLPVSVLLGTDISELAELLVLDGGKEAADKSTEGTHAGESVWR